MGIDNRDDSSGKVQKKANTISSVFLPSLPKQRPSWRWKMTRVLISLSTFPLSPRFIRRRIYCALFKRFWRSIKRRECIPESLKLASTSHGLHGKVWMASTSTIWNYLCGGQFWNSMTTIVLKSKRSIWRGNVALQHERQRYIQEVFANQEAF